ncbi:MAG: transcriptional regulator [Acidobacteria bacterium]|nr:transcriptional regulator [Acidobacteriota bacterium]
MPIDPLIHAPVRLEIMSALAVNEQAEFTFLRKVTGTTDGNLATHLRRLEEAGYVEVEKRFVKRRPQTLYRLTETGRAAFDHYLDELEALLPPRERREKS